MTLAAVLGAGLDSGPAHLLIHTSGALPADALRAPGTERALLLSLHPIQTIAHPGSAEQLAGSAFGLKGSLRRSRGAGNWSRRWARRSGH